MSSLIKNPQTSGPPNGVRPSPWMHYAYEFWFLSADAGQERKKAGGQRNPLKRLKMDKGIQGNQSLGGERGAYGNSQAGVSRNSNSVCEKA